MNKLIAFVCLHLCVSPAHAQVDSMLAALGRASEDTAKAHLLRDLGWKYMLRDADSSLMFYQQSYELSKRLQDYRGEILGLLNIAGSNSRRGGIQYAEQLYRQALVIAKAHQDDLLIAICSGRLASHYSKDDYHPDSALIYYTISEEYQNKTGNPYLNWMTHLYRGELYYQLGMLDKAESDLLEALRMTTEKKERIDQGMVLHRLVRNFFDLKQWDKYSQYSEAYLKFLDEGDAMKINNSVHRILYFFEDEASPKESIPVIRKLVETHERLENHFSAMDALKFLSRLQMKEGHKAEAIASLERVIAIARENNYLVELETTYYDLYTIAEQSNDVAEAFRYFKLYKSVQDTVEVLDNRKLFEELQVKYETQKKDEALTLQQLELDRQHLVRRNLVLIVSLLSLSILAALAFLYFNRKTNRTLKGKNALITQALRDKELLLREIHHRVKNNLQVISSLLNLQSHYISDEKAIEAIQEGRNRVHSMSLIHQNLYMNENLTSVDVGLYLEKLSDSLFQSYNTDPERISMDVHADQTELDVDTLIPLGLIMNELLSNALKHAFPDKRHGEISIRFLHAQEHFLLEVKDNGIGMQGRSPGDIRDSFGLEMINAFVQKLKASIDFETSDGVTVRLLIPKPQMAA